MTGPETSTSLFGPPDYDNIVGGVPQLHASTLLLAGIICLVVGAVGMAIGADMSQWWILGDPGHPGHLPGRFCQPGGLGA